MLPVGWSRSAGVCCVTDELCSRTCAIPRSGYIPEPVGCAGAPDVLSSPTFPVPQAIRDSVVRGSWSFLYSNQTNQAQLANMLEFLEENHKARQLYPANRNETGSIWPRFSISGNSRTESPLDTLRSNVPCQPIPLAMMRHLPNPWIAGRLIHPASAGARVLHPRPTPQSREYW